MVLSFPEYAHPLEPIPGFSRYVPYPSALGALDPQSQQIAGIAATAVTTTGGILASLAMFGAASGPIGAAIAGLAAIGVAIANVFSGCGQVCVQTANIDNQVEPILLQNLNHYMNSPVHYASMQAAALNNFDIAWQAYSQAELAYGTQGQTSITERATGGCHWKPNGVCWNWFTAYRDPISNDPNVVPDPVPGAPSGSGVTVVNPDGSVSVMPSTMSRVSMTPLLIGAGVILAALMIGGGK